MPTSNQFSIAVHIMASLGFRPEADLTSTQLAASVNTSPVFLRRTLAKLSKAKLIETAKGKNGFCRLRKNPEEVSLLNIYQAIEAPKAFSIHKYEEMKLCQVSSNIKPALENALNKAQKAMESSLEKTTLKNLLAEIKRN